MKKVFLSLPMSGRTQENIEFTIKAMTKKAKEILGEDIEVSHLANIPKAKVDNLANPGIYNMVLAASGMLHCDYFMGFSRAALNLLGTVTHSTHYGCILEEDLWYYSQRHNHNVNEIVKLNDCYISAKRLPGVSSRNISEYIPELDTEEKVQIAKLLLNSTFGMHGKLHINDVIEDVTIDNKESQKILKKYMLLDKDLAIPYTTKDNKEVNNGKEENN